MAGPGDPRALGQLLRSRRERLVPAEVGLPAGSRRRTAGLRREEVAALANISTTYYTFLEQGRPGQPSDQVLDALGSALRMSPAELGYLHVLAHGAHGRGNADRSRRPVENVEPAVADLIDRLDPFPTYLKGRCWDLLAWNRSAGELFGWDEVSVPERNLVRWMFTSEQARLVYLDWEQEAHAMLSRFRLAAARSPGDPRFAELVAELQRSSEHVGRWWPRHDVQGVGSGTKRLRHPAHGPTAYSHLVLQVADTPDQTLVTFNEGVWDQLVISTN